MGSEENVCGHGATALTVDADILGVNLIVLFRNRITENFSRPLADFTPSCLERRRRFQSHVGNGKCKWSEARCSREDPLNRYNQTCGGWQFQSIFNTTMPLSATLEISGL